MAYVKTQYRKKPVQAFADGGVVEPIADAPAPEAPVEDIDPSLALKQQILALERSIALSEEKQRQAQQAPPVDALEQVIRQNTPEGQRFLRAHPNYLTVPEDSAKIHAVDRELKEAGFEAYSPEYWAEMESRLLNQSPKPAGGEVYTARSGNSKIVLDGPRRNVQAPPSRETSDTLGARYWSGESTDPDSVRITLSPAEKGAAAIAGCSLEEYARQLIRLRAEKKAGNYQ